MAITNGTKKMRSKSQWFKSQHYQVNCQHGFARRYDCLGFSVNASF